MNLREETLEIFRQSFGPEKANIVLEFIEDRIPDDVATQRNIYELKLEIEKVRADLEIRIGKLDTRIETLRGSLETKLEKMRGDLETKIEKMHGDLETKITKMQGDLETKIEKQRNDLIKWSFGFWITQMALLAGIMFKLLG